MGSLLTAGLLGRAVGILMEGSLGERWRGMTRLPRDQLSSGGFSLTHEPRAEGRCCRAQVQGRDVPTGMKGARSRWLR